MDTKQPEALRIANTALQVRNKDTPGWPAADRAYQHHHAACPQCRAAGTSPNTQQRCPEGAQLWGTYQQAGDPPHFTWLRKRQGRKP